MSTRSPFRYFKTSPAIIRLVVMMYVRFPLSLRNVENLLHERGIDVSHETIRFWWNRFGPSLLRSRRCRSTLDPSRRIPAKPDPDRGERSKASGERRFLWRAVDHEGEVLEAVVTKRRDKRAVLKLLKKLMKRYGRPAEIVTDRPPSHRAAMRELGSPDKQTTGRWLNNRIENSHQPFRRRERAMLRFRRMRSVQGFAAVHAPVHNHFNLERHLHGRDDFKQNRDAALDERRRLGAV